MNVRFVFVGVCVCFEVLLMVKTFVGDFPVYNVQFPCMLRGKHHSVRLFIIKK